MRRIEEYHHSYFKSRTDADVLSQNLLRAFIAINVIFYLKLCLLCFILFIPSVDLVRNAPPARTLLFVSLLEDEGRITAVLNDAQGAVIKFDMIFQAAVDLAIALGFLFYGVRLYHRAARSREAHSHQERRELKKVQFLQAVILTANKVRYASSIVTRITSSRYSTFAIEDRAIICLHSDGSVFLFIYFFPSPYPLRRCMLMGLRC
jgi:hypothetical protein